MNTNWHSIFNDFKKIKVLIVGDAMIDSYMWGSINRQSPEAPIPIVDIEKYEKEILNSFSASELIQVIKNKLIFLGVDLSKLSLNNIKTPLAFSEFIQTISKYRVGLKN